MTTRRAPAMRPPTRARRESGPAYFVPVLLLEPLGLEDEPDVAELPDVDGVVALPLDVVVSVVVDDPDGVDVPEPAPVLGDVDGDADGVVVVPGRSPTRSVRDSEQPASAARPIVSAHAPVSILFIWCSSSPAGSIETRSVGCNPDATVPGLTAWARFTTTAGGPRRPRGRVARPRRPR